MGPVGWGHGGRRTIGNDFTYKSVASSADGSHLILVASAAGMGRSVCVNL